MLERISFIQRPVIDSAYEIVVFFYNEVHPNRCNQHLFGGKPGVGSTHAAVLSVIRNVCGETHIIILGLGAASECGTEKIIPRLFLYRAVFHGQCHRVAVVCLRSQLHLKRNSGTLRQILGAYKIDYRNLPTIESIEIQPVGHKCRTIFHSHTVGRHDSLLRIYLGHAEVRLVIA